MNEPIKKKEEKKREKVFTATITETLTRKVIVRESELKFPTKSDAEQTVSDRWHMNEIILTADDFKGVEFTAEEGDTSHEDI